MAYFLLPIFYSDSFFFDQAKPNQAKSKRGGTGGKAKTGIAPSSSSDEDSSSSEDSKLNKTRAAFKR